MPGAVSEILIVNDELVAAAKATLRLRFRPYWHVVAAALRTASGQIVTGIHLEAQVGRIAVCAEAIALGCAVAQFGTSDFTHIVAVQGADPDGAEARVVPPCGMCREMITTTALVPLFCWSAMDACFVFLSRNCCQTGTSPGRAFREATRG